MNPTSFMRKRDRVLEIDRTRKELIEERLRLLGELQESCGHELVIEFDNHTACLGDVRICGLCGLREKHTGFGFHVLTKEPVKREDIFYLTRYFYLKPLGDLFQEAVLTTITSLKGV